MQAKFMPSGPPVGTDNFGNLLREPGRVMQDLVAQEVARRGFEDLRPALLAVGQHVRADGSRVTELAELSMLTKPTVVHMVDELERLGYVERRPDPADGRAKLVVLTGRGREAEAAGREAIAQIHEAWTALIGEPAMARLEADLRTLRDALWPPARAR
ncbi:MAG TPA: MarR family transcriptional regulator [Thermoleophilaceae bacterium]|nr:MarR family transcriptional regulator [Thermoleophilaceae bacterium]